MDFCTHAALTAAPSADPARIPPAALPQVRYGQRLWVVGNQQELGSWNVDSGLKLKWHEGHVWSAAVELDVGSKVEYKVWHAMHTQPAPCDHL